jgi:hypothetical protein
MVYSFEERAVLMTSFRYKSKLCPNIDKCNTFLNNGVCLHAHAASELLPEICADYFLNNKTCTRIDCNRVHTDVSRDMPDRIKQIVILRATRDVRNSNINDHAINVLERELKREKERYYDLKDKYESHRKRSRAEEVENDRLHLELQQHTKKIKSYKEENEQLKQELNNLQQFSNSQYQTFVHNQQQLQYHIDHLNFKLNYQSFQQQPQQQSQIQQIQSQQVKPQEQLNVNVLQSLLQKLKEVKKV